MKKSNNRRFFLKNIAVTYLGVSALPIVALAKNAAGKEEENPAPENGRRFNDCYKGKYNNRIAFPIGGIGAGMFCLEGTGAISHMSIRHNPEMFYEPAMFAAISIKGGGARVLEGQVPDWKKFGQRDAGLGGSGGATWGLPRFREAAMIARFPFADITLNDPAMPVKVALKGWSPFIPGDEDHASMPIGALEYHFTNTSHKAEEFIFSYHARNFMRQADTLHTIKAMPNGFVLVQDALENAAEKQGHFAIYTPETNTIVDHCWFRGGWFDPLTMVWNTLKDGHTRNTPPVEKEAPGASLFVPFHLKPGEKSHPPPDGLVCTGFKITYRRHRE